jgi:predicted  nucleic acid-binding Zn-ribbon protein
MKKPICFVALLLSLGIYSAPVALAQEDKSGPGGEKKEKIEQKKKEGTNRPELKGLSPEERDAKRKEMRERMQKQLADLRKRKAEGSLNEQEKKRLERMEEINKRFEQAGARAGSTNKVGNVKGSGQK